MTHRWVAFQGGDFFCGILPCDQVRLPGLGNDSINLNRGQAWDHLDLEDYHAGYLTFVDVTKHLAQALFIHHQVGEFAGGSAGHLMRDD